MGKFRATSAALVALVAFGTAACGADNDSSSAIPDMDVDVPEARAGDGSTDAGEVGESGDAATRGEPTTAGSSAPAAPLGLDALGRAIAVEAGVTIGTPDVRQAVDDTLGVVRRANATVYDADVNIGDEREDGSVDGNARVVVKVDPARLDALIADLDGVTGTLVGRTQTSEDVTNQLVDLDIRIRVERTAIDRFETLLGEATEFADVVDIQRVISERTVTLEQLLAGERNLEQRVDLSTLTIDLQYMMPTDVVPAVDETDDGIADAFRSGWDALVGALFIVGFVLAVAAPFLGIALLAGLIALIIARMRRRRADPSATVTLDPPSPAVRGEHEVADGAVGEHEGSTHAGVGDHLG